MSNRKYDLLCTGAAIVDCIVKGLNPEPVSSYGYTAESTGISAGGEALNEACVASRLGLKTAALCFVGKDAAGSILENALVENGVDVSFVAHPDVPTPVTDIILDAAGDRKSITNNAHRYNFHPERYADVFLQFRAISLGSLFRAPYNDPEIIYSVVTAAHDAGNLIFADTKLPNFVRLTLEDIKDSLPYVDYVFPNEPESEFYTGRKNPGEAADVLLGYGIKNAIIKLGGDGCLFKNAEEMYRMKALPVKAVDATGAGDNFIAGFIAKYLECGNNYESLLFANGCGALCATAVGTISAIKGKKQVEDFLIASGCSR